MKANCVIAFFFVLFFASCKKELTLSVLEKTAINTNKNIYHISFIDEQNGFVSGGSRYDYGFLSRSNDGGTSWGNADSVVGSAAYAHWFFTPQRGFISGFNNDILFTPDLINFNRYNSSFWLPPREIKFLDSLYGAIVYGNGYGAGGVSITSDGGQHWQEQSFVSGLYSIAVLDRQTILLFGYGVVLKSTDGGTTFSFKKLHGDFYRSNYFFDNKNGVAVGYQGEIIYTADAGENWSIVKKTNGLTNSREHLLAVHFNTDKKGYAVGENGLVLYSDNGGMEWMEIKNFTEKNLNTVWVKSDGSAMIGGDEGTLFHIKP